jgi:HSP20 family protein
MKDLQTRTNKSPFYFDSVFDDVNRIFDGFSAPMFRNRSAFLPTYELLEDENSYQLAFDLPGIPKESINIEVKDQQLRVFGERNFETKEGDDRRRVSERRYGSFERAFMLPNDVNAEKIQATSCDGVLTLTLPKTAKAQERTIKVESQPTRQ